MQGKGNVAIGIDLGTTFSCIAFYKNNKIEIIPNEMGDPTTPSIVTFSGDKIYAGEETIRIQTKDPKNTIFGVKRLIGRYYEDKEVQNEIKKYWAFKVEPGEEQQNSHLPVIVVDYEGKKQRFAPEQISSLVLMKLKKSAERYLGTEVNSCVVTIPAHFKESQKNATIKACQKAGFTVLGTLNEPEAAALAFGLEGKNNKSKKMENPDEVKNILIFDLGGGTFDVSILELNNLVFTDKGKFGDPHFGGEDFDNALVDYCINKFYEMKKIKIDKNNDPEPLKRLKMSCENAKKILSNKEVTQIELSCLKDNEDLSLEITRDLFENICGHLFDKCISPIYDLLNKIGISPGGIDDVVLIGGSTRIPRIRKMIKSIFYQEPNTSINPDEAVAYGAAILAAKLSGTQNENIENLLIKDITPFTLGIAVVDPKASPMLMLLGFLNNLDKFDPKNKKSMLFDTNEGKLMSSIIKKGSPIPFDNTHTYHTLNDFQEEVEIEVFEGESMLVKNNNLLGRFRIKNLPKKKAEEVKFDVNFKIDSNGILTVTAQLIENKENKEQLVVETYKGGVSKNEYNFIDKIKDIDPKDNKFYKMRDLRLEMDKYYDKIINPKKEENDDDDDEEDEEIKQEKKERKEEKEFNIICNYSHSIEEFISLFDKKDLNNEAILEKIFEYLDKLFNSYKMALKIKSQATKDFQNQLVGKIMEIFSKFFEIKIFWLLNLLEVLKGTPIKFFFEVAVNLIQLFLIRGQMYQNDLKAENFNKLYAKQYYKAALNICEKYKLDKEKDRVDRNKAKGYQELKNKCIAGINNLDSEYLIEVKNSLSFNKLISNDYANQKERLHLLLDSFHQNIARLEGIDDKESYKSIALCYANVIKIEYKLLKIKNNLFLLNDYGNKCIEIAKKTGIKKPWFKEFMEIKKEIEDEIKRNRDENNEEKRRIKENMRNTLNDISEKAKNMKNCDFIKYIIDNHPPIGYKKENNYYAMYNENPDKTLEELTTLYHTSNYHGEEVTYEKYLVIEQIETELNKMKANLNEPLNKINIV